MLNIKKMVLFLIVGIFLFGMANFVFAGFPNPVGFHVNITGISKSNTTMAAASSDFYFATTLTKDSLTETKNNLFDVNADGVFIAYLRNTTADFTNGWLINITIFNFNTTNVLQNISRVNISLPPALNASGGTAGTCIGNASDVAGLNCTVYGNGRDIVWIFDSNAVIITNGSRTNNNSAAADGVGNATFTINVTSEPSLDGKVNIRVRVSNDSTGAYGAVGGAPCETEFNISDKIYLDGTIPTFDSAKTDSTTTLNLTFSENMNSTTIEIYSFNVTYTNRTGGNNSVGVSATDSQTTAGNDTMATLTIEKIEANETPHITLNMTAITMITDLAGYEIATNISVTATDGAPPTFKSGEIDLSVIGTAVNLTLDWDEPMSAFGTKINNDILILIANNTESNVSVQNPLAVTARGDNGTRMYITLNFTDQSNVSRWRTGINLTIHPNFFNDTAGSIMSSRSEKILLTFTNDTTRPRLINYSYYHSTNGSSHLLLGFNEPVDLPTVTETQIKLAWDQNHNASVLATLDNLTATGGSGLYVELIETVNSQTLNNFYKTINVTFSHTTNYTDIIAWWDRKLLTSLYLSLANNSAYDLVGNSLNATDLVNTSGVALTGTNWVKDTAVPKVLKATISDTNVTGPGVHKITIYFTENMTNSTFTLTTLPNLIEEDSVAIHTSTDNVFNFTFLDGTAVWEGYYNFTQGDTNGEWNITVSTSSTDLSGNVLTNESTDLRFSYDSEPPYIIYAYYLENGTNVDIGGPYNGTLAKNDTLVLVFNEPLQPVDLVNISCGNLTFRDGVFCGGNLSTRIRNNLVILTSSTTPTLSLRGEWVDVANATELQNRTNRNLNRNSSTWYIRDKADNFATNKSTNSSEKTTATTSVTGPKTVIADYAIKVTSNKATTISFPTCVNTGNMSDYLSLTASDYTFATYYNTNTWGEHAVTALVPLVGYRFTSAISTVFTYSHSQWGNLSDNMLRIYLDNKSECALSSNEITVDDGWNYLALNGNYYSSSKDTDGRMKEYTDAWLYSLAEEGTTDSIQVDWIVKGFGNTTTASNTGEGGTADWDNWIISPYEAFWVGSQASNTFRGTARW